MEFNQLNCIDDRYLYVNVRPWPPGCTIENPMQPPPIAQEIDIHVIDLVSMKQVGSLLRAHRAYTPNDECFFIFLDVSPDYVARWTHNQYDTPSLYSIIHERVIYDFAIVQSSNDSISYPIIQRLIVFDCYVDSGAEDKHGYLWDRYYGLCLAKFPHNDVVNSVAFNPMYIIHLLLCIPSFSYTPITTTLQLIITIS